MKYLQGLRHSHRRDSATGYLRVPPLLPMNNELFISNFKISQCIDYIYKFGHVKCLKIYFSYDSLILQLISINFQYHYVGFHISLIWTKRFDIECLVEMFRVPLYTDLYETFILSKPNFLSLMS